MIYVWGWGSALIATGTFFVALEDAGVSKDRTTWDYVRTWLVIFAVWPVLFSYVGVAYWLDRR